MNISKIVFFYLTKRSNYLFICLSVCLCDSLSVCRCDLLSVCLCDSLSVCLCDSLSFFCVCMYFCLFVGLSSCRYTMDSLSFWLKSVGANQWYAPRFCDSLRLGADLFLVFGLWLEINAVIGGGGSIMVSMLDGESDNLAHVWRTASQ